MRQVQLSLQRMLLLLLLDDLQGLVLILRLLQLLMHNDLLLLVLLNLCRSWLDLDLLDLRVERHLLLPFVNAFDVLVQIELSR